MGMGSREKLRKYQNECPGLIWWLTPVIPFTLEAKSRRITV
jgi:hypothetical protein